MTSGASARLCSALGDAPALAIAVSGGVDSMTLAVVLGRGHPSVVMYHALSPAVPPNATARVEAYAAREGWQLSLLDAGEFDDERYRQNPVNRCYFCKSHLYETMSLQSEQARAQNRVLCSGTNLDDLSDFRPGLLAARTFAVRHPYVEAGLRKSDVRTLARSLGLTDLADLPAAPCLSSRVETGIRIEPGDLRAVHEVESAARASLAADTVRCRVRRNGIVIELDEQALSRLSTELETTLRQIAASAFGRNRTGRPALIAGIRFERYAMGSAFLAEPRVRELPAGVRGRGKSLSERGR